MQPDSEPTVYDLPGAEKRLRDFLIQRFGRPATYQRTRGHPRLRMRHSPFAIDQAGRDRWVQLMEAALAEVNLPAEATTRLREYFHEGATFMINQGDFQGMDARHRPQPPGATTTDD
jgi:hemoglobin